MEHDRSSEPLEVFRRYTQMFGALDARGVAQLFHEPAMLISPREVLTLATHVEVEATFARIMKDLPKDYVRTEFSSPTQRRIDDDLAEVSGGGAWKDASNRDMMPFGLTYLLRRTGGTWRIIVAATHGQ